MEQTIKLFLFIKIALFIYLIWICHFNHDMGASNKSLDENCNSVIKIGTRNYRNLARYKQNNYSSNIFLKENFSKNGVKEQRDISNNEKRTSKKKKHSFGNSLNKEGLYIQVIDYNNGMFDGKHFHFIKKWVKKKDHDAFFEINKKIGDINLKKITFRKYGYGGAIFLIFLLLGIGIPVLSALPEDKWKWIDSIEFLKNWKDSIETWIKGSGSYASIILFTLLIVILSFMLIIATYKILINNEKYEKIKWITN
ncbi:fam-m protein [Plasmodium malariae]|uniref:Fam-m protein n=1 Tax=Plasmodium malariae TaxID=5858 RepID=A0A1D3TDL2_PLAMA|nr:fam-m protein [Plasmodium malariae]SCP02985.1 fam-m protein [Plasmodium malariae]